MIMRRTKEFFVVCMIMGGLMLIGHLYILFTILTR